MLNRPTREFDRKDVDKRLQRLLSDVADLIYKVTDYYTPEWDRTLRWDDPDLGIQWPLSESGPPKLSEKDAQGSFLPDADHYE